MKKGKIQPAYIAVVISMVGMSISAPLNKLAMAVGMPPAMIIFWRLGLASMCTMPIIFGTAGGRRELSILFASRKDVLLMAASSLFLALHFYTWVISLTITSTFGCVVLVSAHPVFTMLGDRLFFKQRFSKGALIGAAVSLLGIVIVGGNSILRHEGNLAGDLLALAGALMFGGYMLIGRELRSRYSINTYTTVVYGFSAAMLAAAAALSGIRFAPYPAQAFGYVALVVVVSTLLGHTLTNWSLAHLPASTVSVMLLAGPFFTGIWSYLLLGELPSPFLLAGGVITVLGMALFLLAQVRVARIKAAESAASL